MEHILQPWVSWRFLQAVKKMEWNELETSWNPGLQNIFHGLNIYLIYIYLSLLYNSSILDIEHSPYYIALGSAHTHKMI